MGSKGGLREREVGRRPGAREGWSEIVYVALVVALVPGCWSTIARRDGSVVDGGGLDGGVVDGGDVDGGTPIDAPLTDDVPDICRTTDECDVLGFCVDQVRCAPGDPRADARGCVHDGPPPPCAPGYICVSERRGCWCPDRDGDGQLSQLCGGLDCDDTDPSIPRFGLDECDDRDTDCDGRTDEDLIPLYADEDGDGYAADGSRVVANGCPGEGYAAVWGDCDEHDASVHPGATQLCDGRDNACDPAYVWEDADRDGYVSTDAVCVDAVPSVLMRGDCLDGFADIGPGRPERCNTLDDDCDPATADGSAMLNGCLPGHACIDGACGQTVSLGMYGDQTCGVLSDGTTRCWGLSACYDGFPGRCLWPNDLTGWRDVRSLDPSGLYGIDTSGMMLPRPGEVTPSAPPARLLGPFAQCLARADTGGLWCQEVGDMPGPLDIVQLEETCARTAGGEIWCWGPNESGQVGDGTLITRALPVRVVAADAVDVGAVSAQIVAVMRDGSLLHWGDGRTLVPAPLEIAGLSGVTEVAAGSRTLFLRGSQPAMEVSWFDASAFPREVPGTANLHGLVAMSDYACALGRDGRVLCFGSAITAIIDIFDLPLTAPITIGGL